MSAGGSKTIVLGIVLLLLGAAPSEQRYVKDVSALRFRSLDRHATPIERLPIGTALRVGSALSTPDGRVVRPILSGGRRDGGFVLEGQLSETPPDAADLVRDAAEQLAEGSIPEAENRAERARALSPTAIEPRQILAAIFDEEHRELGARRVYAELARLHAPPPLAPDPWEQDGGVLEPGPAFAIATHLRVRGGPNRDARVVAEAPLNAPVQILKVEGGWARVRLQIRTLAPLDLVHDVWDPSMAVSSFASEAEADAGTVEGWAASAFLSEEPLEKGMLVATASQLDNAGNPAALSVFQRAAMLDPEDGSLLQRLARRAVDTKRWQVAAWAAARLVALRQGGEGIQLELFYGCRPGTRDCLADVDSLGPCEPCPVYNLELATNDALTPRERAAIEAEDAERGRKERQEYAKQYGEWRRRFDRIEPVYADSPWLKATLTGSAKTASKRFLAYALPFGVREECVSGWDRLQPSLSRRPIDFPAPGQTETTWIRVPSYANISKLESGGGNATESTLLRVLQPLGYTLALVPRRRAI